MRPLEITVLCCFMGKHLHLTCAPWSGNKGVNEDSCPPGRRRGWDPPGTPTGVRGLGVEFYVQVSNL